MTKPKKIKYPDADESTWPPNAKKSKEELVVVDGALGKIISDGERGYICTKCGKVITKAHHIKPEKYKFMYEGQAFYLERHICDKCMKSKESSRLPVIKRQGKWCCPWCGMPKCDGNCGDGV